MKYSLCSILAFFAICSSLTLPANALMEEPILAFLEEWRMRMCHPISKLGLPAVDPFAFDHVAYSMDNKYLVDFTGSLTNFAITGISDFEVRDLKISIIPGRRTSLELVLPRTALDSLYTAKGSIARVVNLNGDAKAEIRVDTVRVAISWIFKIGLTGISGLRIELSIGDLWVDIEELVEEPRVDDFLRALVNEMGIELLNDVWVEAQEKGVIGYIENIANGYLDAYSLSDIIKIIAGGGGEGGGPFDGIPADCKETKIKNKD